MVQNAHCASKDIFEPNWGMSVWIKAFKPLTCIIRYPMHRMRENFNKCLTLQHRACVSGNGTYQAFGYSLVIWKNLQYISHSISHNKKAVQCVTHTQSSWASDGILLRLLLQAHRSFGLWDDMRGSVVEESAFMKNVCRQWNTGQALHTILTSEQLIRNTAL